MFRWIHGEQAHTLELGQGDRTVVGPSGMFGTVEIWESAGRRQ